ncbi:hypothetical protein BaRGS_00039344 [Batillaria attramentaria]|uniref:Extracellular sulfatase n=1 Tax=Batillaria attramentaria TaxID=370345 RepID=A0ABD0J404_9CAEN
MTTRTFSHQSFLLTLVLAAFVSVVGGARGGDSSFYSSQDSRPRKMHPVVSPWRNRSEKPNIVLIMTDDQDVLLGSLKAMPKLHDLLVNEGAYFNNSFTSTPMCCPSRSSTLTGLYVHNHNVYTNNDNCSSPQWQEEHEPRTFATYLQKGGYRTGYFGKYLNKYDGERTPVGWDQWVGLVRNSRFYNYTLNYQGSLQKHYDNYYNDYLTDLIANDSVAFFKRSKRSFPQSNPVMMFLSVPAPHGPEDAAPQYQHMFVNNTDHRTASWNLAPNDDKQWLLRQMQPLTPQYKLFTDLLQRRRLQTLQSVDDLVEKVYHELAMLGELDNTYLIFTSDHGYHLGQFGLVKGKSLAYDFDVRVPLVIRGPGIKAGSVIRNVAANVDLAPTILSMAGMEVPGHMDGTSLLDVLKATPEMDRSGFVSKKMIKEKMKWEKLQLIQQSGAQRNLHLYLHPKQQKVARQCANPDNQLPCSTHQCRDNDRDPDYNAQTNSLQADEPQFCQCSDGRLGLRPSSVSALKNPRRHRRFLKHAKRKARGKFLRHRRAALQAFGDFGGSLQGLNLLPRRCRILANSTVSCDQDIYRNYDEWQAHRERIDGMIKEYKKALDDLRAIREHVLENRPPIYPDAEDNEVVDQDPDVDDEECDCENDSVSRHPGANREEKWLQRKLRREQKRQQRMEARSKRRGRRGRKKQNCNGQNMKCFSHDNEHWKTPPYWTFGPFCFCSNANNTHTGLHNIAKKLNYGVLQQLHEQLAILKVCNGRDSCNLRKHRLPDYHDDDFSGDDRDSTHDDEDIGGYKRHPDFDDIFDDSPDEDYSDEDYEDDADFF